jgi:hypothetical protein
MRFRVATDQDIAQLPRDTIAQLDGRPAFEPTRFAAGVTAGLILLDQQAGRRDQVDCVLLDDTLSTWLLLRVQIDDAEAQSLVHLVKSTDILPEDRQAARASLKALAVARPLTVTFVSDDPAVIFPEMLREQTLQIQAASAERLVALGAGYACTIDADGNVVGSRPAKV